MISLAAWKYCTFLQYWLNIKKL